MKEKVFVFDLGGVLIRLNVSRCMSAFEALMGEENMHAVLGMDKNGEGVKAVSVASKQLMADFERGLISSEHFVNEVLQYARPGTTPQQVIDAWMSMLDDLPQERLDIIDRVRAKGYKVFMLSNGNDLHFEYIDRTYHLTPRFDALFLSQKMHIAKPEPEIYQAVHEQITALCSATPDIIFVDDLAVNRQAAEQTVGWTTLPDLASLNF